MDDTGPLPVEQVHVLLCAWCAKKVGSNDLSLEVDKCHACLLLRRTLASCNTIAGYDNILTLFTFCKCVNIAYRIVSCTSEDGSRIYFIPTDTVRHQVVILHVPWHISEMSLVQSTALTFPYSCEWMCFLRLQRMLTFFWQMSHVNQVPSLCDFSRCVSSWSRVLKQSEQCLHEYGFASVW